MKSRDVQRIGVLAGLLCLCAVAAAQLDFRTGKPIVWTENRIQELIDFIAPTDEEKTAFFAEDERRVALLSGYVPGETLYESICGEWDVTTNSHVGFLGFAVTNGNVTVYFGRDVASDVFEQQVGSPSIAVKSRANMIEAASGGCSGAPHIGRPVQVQIKTPGVCTLQFQRSELAENNCAGVKLLKEHLLD